MAVPVPFGQYVPGDSPVHRLDARVKIGLTLSYTIALFAVSGWLGLALAACVVLGAVALSRVPWRLVARGLRPIAWLMLFTVVQAAGLSRGLFFASRIVLLVLGTSLVTLTTSPVALTDAIALLLGPLRVLRVPVDDVATMLSIALRFMPTTAEEAERIVVAQTARGARFDEGGPVKRARAWIPVLVPLFVNLFRRADDLAVAMESRCYRGEGRTRLREWRLRAVDWFILVAGIALAGALAILL